MSYYDNDTIILYNIYQNILINCNTYNVKYLIMKNNNMMTTEVERKTALLLRALDSELRRELIKIAHEEGALDADGYYNEIVKKGFDIKYKESVYKELQLLVESELLEKYYDVKSKKIRYKLIVSKVIIDIRSMESYMMQEDK